MVSFLTPDLSFQLYRMLKKAGRKMPVRCDPRYAEGVLLHQRYNVRWRD